MEESVNVRYVFMMMLAVADPSGVVVGTDVAISRRLNIPLQEFRNCLEILSKPDPESNSPKHEGRRIVQSDTERGYLIVNYSTYRGIKDEQDRREYMRDYMRKKRAVSEPEDVANVNISKPVLAQLTHAEAEEEAETKAKEEAPSTSPGAREKVVSKVDDGSQRLPTTEPAIRISQLFNRRLTTAWAERDVKTFKAIGTIDVQDLARIEAYYVAERRKGDEGRHRRDLTTFLNNYSGELDRANAYANHKPATPVSAANNNANRNADYSQVSARMGVVLRSGGQRNGGGTGDAAGNAG